MQLIRPLDTVLGKRAERLIVALRKATSPVFLIAFILTT
jgi:hypothetical protein